MPRQHQHIHAITGAAASRRYGVTPTRLVQLALSGDIRAEKLRYGTTTQNVYSLDDLARRWPAKQAEVEACDSYWHGRIEGGPGIVWQEYVLSYMHIGSAADATWHVVFLRPLMGERGIPQDWPKPKLEGGESR